MTAKISKWGNSQGLRVSKDVMQTLNLHIGDDVNIIIENNKAIIKTIPEYDLNELVSKIPADYTSHEEFTSSIENE